ncbi:MAG: DUF4430 domain-containing protein [Clostridia bacterium]|nr:DUF4430 domain-containing protein [Clostridia bacterium]
MKRILSLSVACLILLSALFIASCGGKESETELSFTFEVVHLDGTEKTFEVKTYKTILADALTEKGYISGYKSQYGLTVETVDGETLDWNTSGAYWALYINGEYAITGVSTTTIEDGATYTFKAEKM